jgi:hypothetical protein
MRLYVLFRKHQCGAGGESEEGTMNLRQYVIVTLLLACVSTAANAQFKVQADQEARVSDGLMHESAPALFLGWFNPEKFHMRHSLDFSYSTIGGQGISLGTYTNSMTYEIADNLNARADVSLSYSPYNSFSTFGKRDDLSSLYLSRAQLTYKPLDNMFVQIQYRQIPYSTSYFSPFYSPWYRENGF